MKRAAVLIGVDKTGDLPKLKDAARGARLMETWAKSQGITAEVITDEKEPVTVERIKKAIRALVDSANLSQLLVYFAGHGVNLQRQEYWLLTDAPDDSQAAVNVATSSTFAATCGIPHVVLLSDACRTAPEGIRAQSIRGSEIFPNREEDPKPVDQFFACQLGKPSHEIRDPAVTSAEFRALYTNELVPALLGRRQQVIEWTGEGVNRLGHIRPRPLRDFLAGAVAARLVDLQMQTKVIQVPVATISSDPPAWISELDEANVGTRGLGLALPGRGPTGQPAVSKISKLLREAIATGGGLGNTEETGVVRGTVKWFNAGKGFGFITPEDGGKDVFVHYSQLRSAGITSPREGDRVAYSIASGTAVASTSPVGAQSESAEAGLAADARRRARPFGAMHHETGCGFKVRGARVVDVVAHATVDFTGGGVATGDDLRIRPESPASNVLLVLESGAGVLLPALPQFIGALTFDDNELVDVAYEPSDNTPRWNDFQERAKEIRALRAIASSAMARGAFKLEGEDALAIARRMQLAKGVDPSLALYAAYAYHDLQRRELIREMASFMRSDLGAALFDVALLARRLDKRRIGATAPPVLGAVPLMAQGWALLSAFEVVLPPNLAGLWAHRLASLWTMFGVAGVALIRAAFANGELK